jgi:hypothetical protein
MLRTRLSYRICGSLMSLTSATIFLITLRKMVNKLIKILSLIGDLGIEYLRIDIEDKPTF